MPRIEALVRHLRGVGELPCGGQLVELRRRSPRHPVRTMGDAHELPCFASLGEHVARNAETHGLRRGENALRCGKLIHDGKVITSIHVSIVSYKDTFETRYWKM